jgi:DNA-binding transcriptional MerR regulator
VEKGHIPEKITYTRKDVIHLTKLDGRVLDYWEQEFRAFSPTINHTGEKFYSRQDLETIQQIRQWLIVEKIDKSAIRERLESVKSSAPLPEEVKTAPSIKSNTLLRLREGLHEILTLLDKNDITKTH